MGNAVFAGYCQGDVAPTFNGIDLDAARLHPQGNRSRRGPTSAFCLNTAGRVVTRTPKP